jgi:sialidase-1
MKHLIIFQGLLFFMCLSCNRTQDPVHMPVFRNGEGGFACYRIPAVITAPNGDILAFAEARRHSCADFGNVNIVMRRSTDNGSTWDDMTVVAFYDTLQAGNAAPVTDMMDPRFPGGRIFMFYNTGNNHEYQVRTGEGYREVWYVTSLDNGHSWSDPVNITSQVHRPFMPEASPEYVFEEDWRAYANTPGHALQLTRKFPGRILVPANHSAGDPDPDAIFDDYRAHAFYTDDHGETFQISEPVDVKSSNEATAAELSDGRLMQNMRLQNGSRKYRIVAVSSDGGASWDTTYIDTMLPDPVCQGSIIDMDHPGKGHLLLFSNLDSQDERENLTVRLSYDDGASWPVARRIYAGSSAYSDLVIQQDGKAGLLFERGTDDGGKYFEEGGGVFYTNFDLRWLTGQ